MMQQRYVPLPLAVNGRNLPCGICIIPTVNPAITSLRKSCRNLYVRNVLTKGKLELKKRFKPIPGAYVLNILFYIIPFCFPFNLDLVIFLKLCHVSSVTSPFKCVFILHILLYLKCCTRASCNKVHCMLWPMACTCTLALFWIVIYHNRRLVSPRVKFNTFNLDLKYTNAAYIVRYSLWLRKCQQTTRVEELLAGYL